VLQLLKDFKCKVTLPRESPRFAGAEVLLDAGFTVENAPLPQNAPKLVEWCKKCTKTLLYQKLRYNSSPYGIMDTWFHRDFCFFG
jgi:hypothetical protein